MCGILGYIGDKPATQILVDGLRKLEYRGYDSAGVAVLNGHSLFLRRSVGKLESLERLLKKNPLTGSLGLGHTRWATHGAPSETNAHPHTDSSRKIIVVHNGIIENHVTLKAKLKKMGFKFKSETDTEVVAHLIASYREQMMKKNGKTPQEILIAAVRAALAEIEGTFALGILCTDLPDVLIGARRDCPLIVGLGEGENFLASDVPAVLAYTRSVIFLEEGDLAILSKTGVEILDPQGSRVEREATKITWDPVQAEKAGYKHFMLKEIYEQPRTVEDTLLGRLHVPTGEVDLTDSGFRESFIKSISRVRFVACGTSWHAGLIGAYYMEKLTGIPCQVDIASEFRYRDPVIEPRTLIVAISQSGETADTLAAIRLAKKKGAKIMAIANVVGSTLTRDAHGFLLTHCGPEIGVASTKAFMGQLVALYTLALWVARLKKTLPPKELRTLGKNLAHLSQWVTEALRCERSVSVIAEKFQHAEDFLYVGRNLNYPIAMEGALKLKEISYVHAEGYPAGELKHGPIALIDEKMPLVAVVTKSFVYEKMVSNIEEAKSRGAKVIAIATKGDTVVKEKADQTIYVPDVPEDLVPMVSVIPLQILAYKIAVLRGCDVDKPRNLAKSVTVE